jgi:polyisoprenoid-binding protein YceI
MNRAGETPARGNLHPKESKMDVSGQKTTDTKTKTKWSVDPAHSEVSFKVKHMMITNVTGLLRDYTVEAYTEGDSFDNAEVTFVGKLNSITTGNEQRDEHLRSADFFDVENNAEILFKATRYTKSSDDITLEGDLTIKGVTKPITLDVEFNGIGKDPWGNTKAGFSVKGKLNRKDFGLNWNAALEAGGVLVGDDVKILCEIQLVKS